MKKRNEDNPESLGGLGDLLPAEVLKKLNELLEHLHQSDNNKGSKIEFVYVAPGAQNVQHLNTQIINQGAQGDSSLSKQTKYKNCNEDKMLSTPPPDVIVRAVEKTVNDGLWSTNTCWSVVYVVYRRLGYEGSVSDFVKEVTSWKFVRAIKYKCNRDSVGKPLRNKRMTYNIDNWLSDGVQKKFYLLAVALLGEIKRDSRQ
jgi:hypothetical protein